MPYKNEDGTIPSGLRIDIMRHCMENKELLSEGVSHATYVGTGDTDDTGVAITTAFDLSSYVMSVKGAGNICNIESSDLGSKNFERYNYISILTLLDESTAVYSSSECYIGIRLSGDTYIIDTSFAGIIPTDTNTLKDAIVDYKEYYPDGEVYAFDKVNDTIVYYYDTTGSHSTAPCTSDDDVISFLQRSVTDGYQNKPNLYKRVVLNRIYELSVENAIQMNETEQFSSLRGMFGILGRESGLFTTPLIYVSTNSNSNLMMYAGLLRFNQLRFITIKPVGVTEEFSLQNTYFVLSYGGGCDKILYTESQFTMAKNKNYTIYTMPKFNKDNLYFITAPSHYIVNDDISIDNSDYEFLDVYSDYDFIRMIRCHYTDSQLSDGVEIGYFSSNFMDSNYISLGYTSLFPRVYNTYGFPSHFVQFEASETWDEAPYGVYQGRDIYYGYQTRYIVVGNYESSGIPNKQLFRFTEIKKILYNSQTAIYLTDATNPHYMIVFKIVEHNTTT